MEKRIYYSEHKSVLEACAYMAGLIDSLTQLGVVVSSAKLSPVKGFKYRYNIKFIKE